MEMVRREPPLLDVIVASSTPVISFGDFRSASVATLGINPSNREFEINGRLLTGESRRLSTLVSLGAKSLDTLSDEQVLTVIRECNAYFEGPYYGWFDTLNKVLVDGLGVSYLDRSACHLDLVQWATKSKWSFLTNAQRQTLLRDGESHLRSQLSNSNISLVIVNGSAVWSAIELAGLGKVVEIDRVFFGKNRTPCRILQMSNSTSTYLGWSSNLQSQHGANSPELLNQLSQVLGRYVSGGQT